MAGVALANELGKLNLSRNRMLDYCLMIERHPDNVAAALCGGFVGTYLVGFLFSELVKMLAMLLFSSVYSCGHSSLAIYII